MVAPNGARRTKADHPALPLTIPEIVTCASQCFEAGADGIHAHVRDPEGNHVLDAGLYRELIGELDSVVPGMYVQITTEAVGKYAPADQRAVVKAVMPGAVSVALKEMLADGDDAAARDFYHWTSGSGIAVQHILYSAEDVARFIRTVETGIIPRRTPQLLYVLGRYSDGQESQISDLDPFLAAAAEIPRSFGLAPDWALCAFGRAETACLLAGASRGGKIRVGFENNFFNSDGSLASSNAVRVREIAAKLKKALQQR